MVVMPLGPQLRADAGHQSVPVRPDRRRRYTISARARRACWRRRSSIGSAASGPSCRSSAGSWSAPCSAGCRSITATPAAGPDRHGRVRRDSRRHGAGDRRRRLPRRAEGPGHGRPDVGVRAGVGRRRARVPDPGHAVRLARPFLILAALGVPVLFVAVSVSASLARPSRRPGPRSSLDRLRETFSEANHLRAFALTFAIMFGGFSVIPYISLYLVATSG